METFNPNSPPGSSRGLILTREGVMSTKKTDKLIEAIADCLEAVDGCDYVDVAETLIDYLAERGYTIKDNLKSLGS
jgi:hypothetical protein